jgi:hypothetical protein
MKAETRFEKSVIVHGIVDVIRNNGNGRFLKEDHKSHGWYELTIQQAKEKVGHAIRDAANSQEARRKKKREQHRQHPHHSQTHPSMLPPPSHHMHHPHHQSYLHHQMRHGGYGMATASFDPLPYGGTMMTGGHTGGDFYGGSSYGSRSKPVVSTDMTEASTYSGTQGSHFSRRTGSPVIVPPAGAMLPYRDYSEHSVASMSSRSSKRRLYLTPDDYDNEDESSVSSKRRRTTLSPVKRSPLDDSIAISFEKKVGLTASLPTTLAPSPIEQSHMGGLTPIHHQAVSTPPDMHGPVFDFDPLPYAGGYAPAAPEYPLPPGYALDPHHGYPPQYHHRPPPPYDYGERDHYKQEEEDDERTSEHRKKFF